MPALFQRNLHVAALSVRGRRDDKVAEIAKAAIRLLAEKDFDFMVDVGIGARSRLFRRHAL